jgi:hypothetical protein
MQRVSVWLAVAALALPSALRAADKGEMIRGGQSIVLNGPITDPVAARVKAQAFENLREEVLGWLEVNVYAEWNKGNGIDMMHLNTITRSCADRALQDSRFQGKKWLFTYEFPAATLAKTVTQWNQRHDALAVQSYVQFANALEERNLHDAYVFGVRTIVNARAHLGERPQTPGKSGKDFLYETTMGLKSLLERLSLSSSEAVLAGKPGFPPEKDFTVIARIDSTPLAGVHVSAVVPGGRRTGTVSTDPSGVASFKSILMPYTPNGTFFSVVVNPGAEIDSLGFFSLADLGLGLARAPEVSLMYKIVRPTFALNYKASALGDMVIPRDFSQPEFLAKFLRDSCFLDPAPPGANSPDLILGVVCQASSYYHDATESQVYRTEMQVEVEEKNGPRHARTQRSDMYEKSSKAGMEASTGIYFWEATRALGATIKAALGGL